MREYGIIMIVGFIFNTASFNNPEINERCTNNADIDRQAGIPSYNKIKASRKPTPCPGFIARLINKLIRTRSDRKRIKSQAK